MKQVDDLHDLDDATKTKVKGLYQQALSEMEAAKHWATKAMQFEQLATRAPLELAQTKAALAALPSHATTSLPADVAIPQLEQAISQRETELAKWQTALNADDAELKGRASRRAQIPDQITAAQKRLVDINADLQAPAAAVESSPETAARRFLLVAQRRTAERELLCCEKELAAYEARTELLPLSRDLDARQVAAAQEQLKQWREWANQRRQREADQQVRQAAHEAGQAHPAVRRLVEGNAALAAMRKQLAERIVETTRSQEAVSLQLSTLKEQFKRVQQKVEAAGKTNTISVIGQMLRKQREMLPNLREYRRNIGVRRQTISEGQLALLQLQDSRAALANLDQQTKAVLQGLGTAQQTDNPAELEAAVHDALNTERNFLDDLIGDHNTYFDKLVDLANSEQQLIDETERCARYIDERVLWIASTGLISINDARPAADAAWWLVGPDACLDLGRTLAADAAKDYLLFGFALCAFLAWLWWRPRFRARILEIGEKTSRGSCCRFAPTVETTVLTFLVAVGWPALMWYLGWRLILTAEASALCKSVGYGLVETAKVFLALQLLQHTCAAGGLAESHFGWSTAALKVLRQNARWFSLPALPLMGVAVAMAWQENDHWDAALGRFCFVVAMLFFTLALHQVLRPRGVVFQAVIASRRGGWLDRFRYVWYPLCVLTPFALAVLGAIGYHYTARQLVIRLILTCYVVVGAVACRALLLRWALVTQRRLAIEQSRRRRTAAQGEAANGEENPCVSELPPSETPERDLATINAQTRRLVEYSLAIACVLAIWCAWVDVLPALGSINVTMWRTTVTVAELESLPDGHTQLKATEALRDVTLADICLTIIVLATTFIAAKNIPGLLEIAVLQHLPFDAGARYAVATVCRYLITMVGILLCFAILGVGWSNVQWLVAAMSLGLGFGLQEIFANFISGLIILFERPVRVGDVVTIEDVTGVVSRIRMRATTITDGDRKELIIPNKIFITGQVLNWTLTDSVNRVSIKVGVAYGSDTDQVSRILLKVAHDHPLVLDDPPPGVSLESFGDSALNFVLRCFLPNMDNRGAVIHELHVAIDREFKKANIEMPFPQQDVRVRSFDVPDIAARLASLRVQTPEKAA